MSTSLNDENLRRKCQIFTPDNVVSDMLDYLGYVEDLYGKKVFEGSCGNGQFLKEVVKRYINFCKKMTENYSIFYSFVLYSYCA